MTKIFGSKTCSACINLKNQFRKMGVNFEEIDITENIVAKNEILSKGFWSIPVVKINNDYFSGTQFDKIREILHI